MIWSGSSRALVICKENEFVFMEAKVTVYEGVHCTTTDNIKLDIYVFFFFFLFFLKSKSNRYIAL